MNLVGDTYCYSDLPLTGLLNDLRYLPYLTETS